MRRFFVAILLAQITAVGGQSPVASNLVQQLAEDINRIEVKGVSGKRFSGEAFRVSQVPKSFQNLKRSDLKDLRSAEKRKHCPRWIVVTSIFQPSDAVRKLGEMTKKGWCFVVVADVNGPTDYDDVEGVVYLTPQHQKRLHYHIVDYIPWRHFGRKNIGFLYAIEHGAEVIYDTDDDNRIKELEIPIWLPERNETLEGGPYVPLKMYSVDQKWNRNVVNSYLDFEPTCGERIWPRGFPLDNINDAKDQHPQLTEMEGAKKPPAIQQFLADEDPDVDAIFRLTGQLPCRFAEKRHAVVLPKGQLTPYNAQCVVNLKSAFWALLLPVTVNGRVSDIWRSYIAQKLLWDIDEHVAFMPAHVIHDRVFHDYLKDFQSELDLYLKGGALVKFLVGWRSDAPTLVERIEQLWTELYERGFVEEGDLRLAQAWIRDLLALGYRFPELKIPKILSARSAGVGEASRGGVEMGSGGGEL
ncbi:unnamed protein product [Amoebophrya sp. A25]|nr:unnamed protein product [Amoebophrya sp. A25]|eukprot:GSA25T00010271001.1